MNDISADIRDKTAIVGIGGTDFGALYRERDASRTQYDLAAQAFAAALDDAGLDKTAIDGLICVRVPDYQRLATMLGLPSLRLVNSLEGTGRMAGVALQYAVAAIVAGQADTIAVVYGNNGRSASAQYGGGFDRSSPDAYDAMYGMTSPGASVALMYRRHQHEFGTTDDALAAVAMNNRKNGALNDKAVYRTPITRDDYFSSRYIAEPLRLYDYCIINDGGVAFIVTRADRARDLRQPPAYVAATYSATELTNFYAVRDYFYGACQDVAKRLYPAAGISPSDVDCAQVYDNFTPTVLFSLEGFDHCPRGESGSWVQDGRIELGGELPVNTSGGHTAESYMQGFGLTIEAVRQVRGQAGARQVPDCEVVQYICASPIVNAHILHN